MKFERQRLKAAADAYVTVTWDELSHRALAKVFQGLNFLLETSREDHYVPIQMDQSEDQTPFIHLMSLRLMT